MSRIIGLKKVLHSCLCPNKLPWEYHGSTKIFKSKCFTFFFICWPVFPKQSPQEVPVLRYSPALLTHLRNFLEKSFP